MPALSPGRCYQPMPEPTVANLVLPWAALVVYCPLSMQARGGVASTPPLSSPPVLKLTHSYVQYDDSALICVCVADWRDSGDSCWIEHRQKQFEDAIERSTTREANEPMSQREVTG